MSDSKDNELRFEARVLRLVDVECWMWVGFCTPKGYGRFNIGREKLQATHWAYERWVRPIPEGLQLDHLCRVRSCVNPWHLEPVTVRENLLRGVGVAAQNAAKTHCPNGHPLAGENLVYRKDGHGWWRRCRVCGRAQHREQRRRWRRKRRELKLGAIPGTSSRREGSGGL